MRHRGVLRVSSEESSAPARLKRGVVRGTHVRAGRFPRADAFGFGFGFGVCVFVVVVVFAFERGVPELVHVGEGLSRGGDEEECGAVWGPRGDAREVRALEGDLGERAAVDGARVDLLAFLLDDGERDGGAVGGDDRAADGARGVRDASRDAAGEGDGVEVVLAHEQQGLAVEAGPAEVPAGGGHRGVGVGGGRRRTGGRGGSGAGARAEGRHARAGGDAGGGGNARSGGDRRRGGKQSRAHATARRDAPSALRRRKGGGFFFYFRAPRAAAGADYEYRARASECRAAGAIQQTTCPK